VSAPEHCRHNLQRCGFQGLGKIAINSAINKIVCERDGQLLARLITPMIERIMVTDRAFAKARRNRQP
jgi:hypothetical protein